MSEVEADKLYRFDGFELDPLKRTLTDPAGNEVKLRPRVLDALIELVKSSPNFVSKADLVSLLWPDRVVEENNLPQTMSALRKGLRAHLPDRDSVVSLPGRGYQFVRPVEVTLRTSGQAEATAEVDVENRRAAEPWYLPAGSQLAWMLGLIAVILVGSGAVFWNGFQRSLPEVQQTEPVDERRQTIAVLPFRNLSTNRQDSYFAAGLHEQLINRIVESGGLVAIAPNSAASFEGQGLSAVQIARRLGVDFALTGSVRIEGESVEVSSRLLDVKSESYLWSETYDREASKIFEIEDDIARKIVVSAKSGSTNPETEFVADRITTSSKAYFHYLEALSLFSDLKPRQPVLDELDAAISYDPNFAEALALKAYIFAMQATRPFPDSNPHDAEFGRDRIAKAQTQAESALRLDNSLSYAHLALSVLHEHHLGTEGGGLNWAKRAYQANPNNLRVLVIMAFQLSERGRINETIPLWERAMVIDPQSWMVPRSYAVALYKQQKFQKAREIMTHAIALSDSPGPLLAICAFISALLEEEDAALAFVRQSLPLLRSGDEPVLAERLVQRNFLMLTYQRLGQREQAQQIFQDYVSLEKQVEADSALMFQARLAMGDKRGALRLLNSRLKRHPSRLQRYLRVMHNHPELGEIRDHPEFKEVVKASLN